MTPLTRAIGAVIDNVDLACALNHDTVAKIREAYLEHLVIFFRNQTLEPSELVRFATYFGKIGYYPFVKGMDEFPEVIEVIKKEDETINFGGLWHTDTSYLENPPLGSILYAKEVPAVGGDTLFANMYMAYAGLSSTLQALIADLRGVNSAAKPDAAVTRTHRIDDNPKDASTIVTTAIHPIARTHPETGKIALYCSDAHTLEIEGMSADESRPLLQYLYRMQQREEYACRWHWETGDVAFWDNRCAQHNALNDYQGQRRVMQRVTLQGERPR
ncbi:MAG: TauD/TfdA family dioxygenase [Pseudomonadota bacterium]